MKFLKQAVTRCMRKAGYSPFYAYRIFKWRWADFRRKDTTLRQKIWAQRRGFYSHKIRSYGLTEENYRDFLSDLDYYRLHPINGIFSRWIDDKLTIRYILDPYSEYLPKYYYHLYDGEILRLPDCPKDSGQSIDDLINLLRTEQTLAAKQHASSEGEGFTKLGFEGECFLINNEAVSIETIKTTLEKWLVIGRGGYLITEYLHPCRELSNFWPHTPNAIRISVIRNKLEVPKITGAFIRFGTQKTGVIDNTNAGGVTCDIDLNDGRFFNGIIIRDYVPIEFPSHPDNNVLMEGFIPNWSLIKEKIIEISKYISEVIYMGYDVVATDDGFKIIEINSHQGIANLQAAMPYLKDEKTKDFFGRLLEEKQRLLAHWRSQTLFGKLKLFMQKIKIRLIKLKQKIIS